MRIYFFDKNNRYIGSRELEENEVIPQDATTESVQLTDGQEAYLINGKWVINNITVSVGGVENETVNGL